MFHTFEFQMPERMTDRRFEVGHFQKISKGTYLQDWSTLLNRASHLSKLTKSQKSKRHN